MFRRRRRQQDMGDEPLDEESPARGEDFDSEQRDGERRDREHRDTGDLDGVADVEGESVPLADDRPGRPAGPWDVDELPDDDVPRLDLGGLRVPVPEGMEVRVEVGPEGQIVAATFVSPPSSMQVSAFAAPKSSGIWDEVRAEILASVRAAGGAAEEVEGEYGAQVRGRVPAAAADGSVALQSARFVGIDGPRWFLRALFTGPAATDPTQAGRLEEALRRVVVVRGREAMGVKDPIPLRLPPEATAASGGEAGGAEAEAGAGGGSGAGGSPGRRPDLDPFARGPEITEVR